MVCTRAVAHVFPAYIWNNNYLSNTNTPDFMLDDEAPGAHAASEPESVETEKKIPAIGIGPGDPAYLTSHGRRILSGADVVVGFASVVEYVRSVTDAAWLTCGYDDQTETLVTFAERVAAGEHGAAVLMGDPNVSGYQFLGRIERALDMPVRVVPGISAVQVAASRARTPLEDTTILTLHERGDLSGRLARLRADAGERHLLVLPRPSDWMPERIATHVLDAGTPPDLDAFVFERLTLDDESRTQVTLEALADRYDPDTESAFSDLSVLVVRRNE